MLEPHRNDIITCLQGSGLVLYITCCLLCFCVVMQTSALPLAAMFGMCALFLLACAICQRQLAKIVEVENKEFELSDSNVNLLSAPKKDVAYAET